MGLAVTQHKLGQSLREALQPKEAEDFFRRSLEIKEANVGPDDLGSGSTLYEMGRCIREQGRPAEAADVFRRALHIREANLGERDVKACVDIKTCFDFTRYCRFEPRKSTACLVTAGH